MARRFQAIEAKVQLQKHLLCQILRLHTASERSQRQAVHRALVGSDQPSECSRVAGLRLGERVATVVPLVLDVLEPGGLEAMG